jgi:L-ascorbate metabolism protein UlaG (beta-lactamase superfamily)
MRRIGRRDFLVLAGGTAAAGALAAACGDDDDEAPNDNPEPAGPTPTVAAGTDNGAIGLRWYGQSMFELTSPGGTRVALDPFNDIGYAVPPPLGVDAVTVTHEHPDHNNAALGGTSATVLRGLTGGGWAEIDETIGDVRLFTVQSFHDDQQGASRGRNAIFVLETGGLRVAHLGDLGHQLDDEQVAALGGAVDVLMVPTGGGFTIDPAGATALMQRLSPRAVFPMHYKTDAIAFPLAPVDEFLTGKDVERVGSTTIRVSRDALLQSPRVYVLDYA